MPLLHEYTATEPTVREVTLTLPPTGSGKFSQSNSGEKNTFHTRLPKDSSMQAKKNDSYPHVSIGLAGLVLLVLLISLFFTFYLPSQ